MKNIIGILLIIFGVALGLYVGIYVCFIGGIADIIEQARSKDISSTAVAIVVIGGAVFSIFAGCVSAFIPIIIGRIIIE